MKTTNAVTEPHRKLTTFGLLILISLAGQTNSFAQYALEKVKEFKINSLYPVKLIDYYPQEGIYLGYTDKSSQGMDIVLVNEEGEIIIEKNMQGEGPEQYVSTLNCLGFSDEGDIWVQTPFEVLRYNHKLKLKERIRYPSSIRTHIYGKLELFPYFFKDNLESGFSFVTHPSGASKYIIPNVDFRKTSLLEVYHFKENRSYEIMPVAERPLYKYLDRSLGPIYFPIYVIDRGGSTLYLTASLDNELTVFDLNTNKTESRIAIDHGEFNSLSSKSITSKSIPSYNHIMLGAKNHKVYKLDGALIALEYIREIPYGTYERKIADNPGYHHFSDPNYHKLIVFDQTRQVSKDLPVPANGTITTSLPNNRFLVLIENPEVEEDFIRYGIFELAKK